MRYTFKSKVIGESDTVNTMHDLETLALTE